MSCSKNGFFHICLLCSIDCSGILKLLAFDSSSIPAIFLIVTFCCYSKAKSNVFHLVLFAVNAKISSEASSDVFNIR